MKLVKFMDMEVGDIYELEGKYQFIKFSGNTSCYLEGDGAEILHDDISFVCVVLGHEDIIVEEKTYEVGEKVQFKDIRVGNQFMFFNDGEPYIKLSEMKYKYVKKVVSRAGKEIIYTISSREREVFTI